ncbi:hypothetical protein BSKO_02215 [Bryopsis sp. KO-2023]|nr:hypothetical protein BSKO_02215 [Bryopsis sp. KO-2023]
MVLGAFREWVNRLSAKAVVQRLDKRRDQHEIDIHRLFLLTCHWHDVSQGKSIDEDYADKLSEEASNIGFEKQKSAVNTMLSGQVMDIAAKLHSILENDTVPEARDPVQFMPRIDLTHDPNKKGKGLAMATGADLTATGIRDAPFVPKMSMAEVAKNLKEILKFSLQVGPSSVKDESSGNGLWIDGFAKLGSVVTLYPGVIFEPLWYRQMTDYPRVDANNPYLLARFDGAVLDAKPWGPGRVSLDAPLVVNPQRLHEEHLNSLEGRNPLALAHYVNHPGKEHEPNIMVASVDLSFDQQRWLRPYIPNIVFRADKTVPHEEGSVLPGLVLVALRDLQDEEIFLNYRLSPHVKRPDWYTPVDKEEEWRRWA